jgi:hypothetical protein
MIVWIEAGLMHIDEDERRLQLIVQGVDGIDEMLGRLLHETNA